MGVSGAGKTTVGKLLAERMGGDFLDADDLHPPANIEKMKGGVPLADADRIPWLDRIAAAMRDHDPARPLAIACSALKESYRDRLGRDRFRLVYLKSDPSLIAERMTARQNHYMPPDLLRSQFDDLEEPTGALTISVAAPPDEIVAIILRSL